MKPTAKTRNTRFERLNAPSLRNWGEPPGGPEEAAIGRNAVLDCGWGRLIFAHTFEKPEQIADILREEAPDARDIALYLRDPHVVLSCAPQELFLDPSHTFRLWLSNYRPATENPAGFIVRRLRKRSDAAAIKRLYTLRHMVPVEADFVWRERASRTITYAIAEDQENGDIIGTATGIDHVSAFDDPENGASLWCLAVDSRTLHTGVGLALVDFLAGHFIARGRSFMDLSVLHDNEAAIALYEKMGFVRVPVFCIKRKNPVNERLFIGPAPGQDRLNPYAEIIVDEARRRGISVEVLNAKRGFFALTHGGRRIVCRESLSELTSAIALLRCDDKTLTHELMAEANLEVPAQVMAGSPEENTEFLREHGAVVVKPLRGEQGNGVSVNLKTAEAVEQAVHAARKVCDHVILEAFTPGEDLRLIVIDFELVAAAVRRPARVTGTGQHTVRELIEKQSRRRAHATGGESRIPMDDETERCVREAGFEMDEVLPENQTLAVRNTANLHTGGTIHDVTDQLHPELKRAAETAARALSIPVVGLDFIVEAPDRPDYVVIEANERPGLANHEPQPTAERFVDLLFPLTALGHMHAGAGYASPGERNRPAQTSASS